MFSSVLQINVFLQLTTLPFTSVMLIGLDRIRVNVIINDGDTDFRFSS